MRELHTASGQPINAQVLPFRRPEPVSMWAHYCREQGAIIKTAVGEPCSWCDAEPPRPDAPGAA